MIQSIAANIDKSQNICGRSRLEERDRANAHVLTVHSISSCFMVCKTHQWHPPGCTKSCAPHTLLTCVGCC